MPTGKGNSDRMFSVDLDGLELPPEAIERIARAVQKAVLLEVASLDLAPEFTVELAPPRELSGGPTKGILIKQPEPE
jgi:hypothetical protein